jgi:hypothetical protein
VLHRPARVQRLDVAEAAHPPAAVGLRQPALRQPLAGLLEPAAALLGPQLIAVVAAGVDELGVAPTGHREAVDREAWQLDRVARPLVVVGAGAVVGAEPERAAADHHPLGIVHRPRQRRQAAAGRRGVGLAAGAGAAKVERLEHGLLVLRLVLDDHPVDVAVGEQRPFGPELHAAQHLEHLGADVGQVGPRLGALEDRQVSAHPAGVVEGVVDAVEVQVVGRAAGDLAQQPQLLEVADVADIPDQRAHDPVVLAVHGVVVQRRDQLVEAAPDAAEVAFQPLAQQLRVGHGGGRALR